MTRLLEGWSFTPGLLESEFHETNTSLFLRVELAPEELYSSVG